MAETKKTVKFLVDRITQEAKPQRFEAGKFYDLPETSAARWVARGAAEYADREPELKLEQKPASTPASTSTATPAKAPEPAQAAAAVKTLSTPVLPKTTK